MAMKFFIFVIFIFSLFFYMIPVENINKYDSNDNIPLATFENALMYTFNDKNITRVVDAQKVVKYQNRDEMFDGDITLINHDISKNFKIENLKADFIVKMGDVYTFQNNVKYIRDDFVKFNTDFLIYDKIKRIAQNDRPFDGIYNNHYMKGTILYADLNNDFITSKNAHFEIDITKDNKGKK